MPYFFDKLDFVFDLLYNILKRNETQGDPHIKILFQGDSFTDGNRYKSKFCAWGKSHQNKKRFSTKNVENLFFLYQNEQKKMTPEGVIFLLIFND